MDDPIFKLEKVVQTRGDEPLEDFEGPLDLILYLLSNSRQIGRASCRERV